MGFKEKYAEARASAKTFAAYGVHSTKNGDYSYLPPGKFKQIRKPVQGAQATFERGSDRDRPTLTRVGAGALIAGPAGAVVGALFKKNTSRNYITVIFSDGDTAIIDGPSKDERKMRAFAQAVNEQAASQPPAPSPNPELQQESSQNLDPAPSDDTQDAKSV